MIIQAIVPSKLIMFTFSPQIITDKGITHLLSESRPLFEMDLLSTTPQAPQYSVCGESTITCETGNNDLDSIPAVVNDYSDMELFDEHAPSDASMQSFDLVTPDTLQQMDSSMEFPNSLSIEETDSEDALAEYVVKKSKPYRPHRSRSPPRNQISVIQRPAINKPKQVERPKPTVVKPAPISVVSEVPSKLSKPLKPSKPKFVFAANIYSGLNKKLSSSGYFNETNPGLEIPKPTSPRSPRESSQYEILRSQPGNYDLHLENVDNIKRIDLLKYLPAKNERRVKESPIDETPVDEIFVEETPVDETPVDEILVEETPVEEASALSECDVDLANESIFDLIMMGNREDYQQPEKQLELIVAFLFRCACS